MSLNAMMNENDLFVSPVILARARELRQPQTPAEQAVWGRVRRRQLGVYFRRQHPIWRFILDFYCASARLVVEIDGDVHAEADQMKYDAARTEWLVSRGLRVIRFTNREVETQLDTLVHMIAAECQRTRQEL
jgi:very-short-patch-repair endonuclease